MVQRLTSTTRTPMLLTLVRDALRHKTSVSARFSAVGPDEANHILAQIDCMPAFADSD